MRDLDAPLPGLPRPADLRTDRQRIAMLEADVRDLTTANTNLAADVLSLAIRVRELEDLHREDQP
jgi:hypothetical protein